MLEDFHGARSWKQRVNIDFADDRLADFAARIVLRNVGVDDVEAMGGRDKAARYLERTEEAFGRPFAPARKDDKGWTTVAQCEVDPESPPGYVEWLRARHPAPEPAAPEEDEADDGCGVAPGGIGG